VSFSTLLVANRGEIACRVLRTAHRLGYRTVAVFSDADAGAPHVRQADQAVRIGPGPAAESYLCVERVLDAARRTGADAVHPGYGFLSERADFAQACGEAGLVFVGPPPAAIEAMGSKAGAKRRMQAAGVPCIPGYLGDDPSPQAFAEAAAELGFPLLVKAVAGGGGRGMRRVDRADDLAAALASARREAESAFGDGRLMLERLVSDGRHIEVQIFADRHGQVIHLGERDCTAQRRRQKVIEEAPSPVVDAALREALGASATAAAAAVGYVGAGTVEFIVDRDLRQHYFLEMNTRLQVEHPVTECITGLDLVEWQLRVAAGEPLPLRQSDIRFDGHAVEARLITEDPYHGWAPQTGRVAGWRPAEAGLRVDHGLDEGQTVTPYYDGMVAKFIAHGRDRADAIRRLRRALRQAPLLGLRHNGRFLCDLLAHPDFAGARMSTTRLDEWAEAGEPLLAEPTVPDAVWRLAAAVMADDLNRRPASVRPMTLQLVCQGVTRRCPVPADGVRVHGLCDGWLHAELDGVQGRWPAVRAHGVLHLGLDGHALAFHEAADIPAQDSNADPTLARAPVAGVVAQVLVRPGDRVVKGQPLASVEAMKMEMWVEAGMDGRVKAVPAQPKASVAARGILVELEPADG
jgi:geranyl-CoA carboxylase alpha subunit